MRRSVECNGAKMNRARVEVMRLVLIYLKNCDGDIASTTRRTGLVSADFEIAALRRNCGRDDEGPGKMAPGPSLIWRNDSLRFALEAVFDKTKRVRLEDGDTSTNNLSNEVVRRRSSSNPDVTGLVDDNAVASVEVACRFLEAAGCCIRRKCGAVVTNLTYTKQRG